jgi:hypothetical protein
MAWQSVTNIKGPKGDQGEQGIQGTQGVKGDKGDQGNAGAAATVAVGTVTTSAPGDSAAVNNAGTTSAALLNFTIPRGIQGPQGEQGTQGLKGDKGDKGDTGDTGAHVNAAEVLPEGTLQIGLSSGATLNAGNVVGPPGADGTSVKIVGSVTDVAALPTGLTVDDAGDGYITSDNGHLHVWDGDSFNDVGSIKGPKGDTGLTGQTGPRGSMWFSGNGVPTAGNTVGSVAGDMYLDRDTGDVYRLN